MKEGMEKMGSSEIKSAIEELSFLLVKTEAGNDDFDIPTRPFLYLCNLVVQVLDKIGPTMTVLRRDIDHNIQRLEMQCSYDPSLYSNLVEVLKKEASEGNSRKATSCSRAFVWLTRSLDFTVELLRRLVKDPDRTMELAVEESYNITLKPWHGWISSAAFRVALKLIPDKKTFINLLMPKEASYKTLEEDIQTLISLLAPLLEEIHSVLKSYGLDRLKST